MRNKFVFGIMMFFYTSYVTLLLAGKSSIASYVSICMILTLFGISLINFIQNVDWLNLSILFFSFFWFISTFLSVQILTNVKNEIVTLYQAAEIILRVLLLITFLVYFSKNLKKWNLYKLIMDSVLISLSTMAMLIPIYNRDIRPYFEIKSVYFTKFTTITSFLFVVMLLVFIITYDLTKQRISNIIILCSFSIFVLVDILINLVAIFEENSIIDFITFFQFLPAVLIVLYMYRYNYEKDIDLKNHVVFKGLSSNGETINFIAIIEIIFIVLLINYDTSWGIFFIVTALVCVDYFFTSFIKISMQNEELLNTELLANEQLEQKVKDRTRDLEQTNLKLEISARSDALTGLYNRNYLNKFLDEIINDENSNKKIAAFFIDIDRFKSINDTYGHDTGDDLLLEVSRRLRYAFISGEYKLFRFGGDEFVLLNTDIYSYDEVEDISQQLLDALFENFSIGSHEFVSAFSVGVAMYPKDASDRTELLKNIEIAMYEAKISNKNTSLVYYDNKLSQKIERKNKIELCLQNANYDEELVLNFQPQFTCDRELVGMETLVRWYSKELGFVPPGEFIEIAEETGMIIDIGQWIIDKAFEYIKFWNEKYDLNLKIGINLSPVQLEDGKFLKTFKEKLQNSGVNPSWIDMEITETAAMSETVSVEDVFKQFASFGIATSIDDFGTGYSSFYALRQYDVDKLKIDKSLIDDIVTDSNSVSIVRAIITMAKELGIDTICEGVEDKEQLAILKELECNQIQGYYFAKPVPADVMEEEYIKEAYELYKSKR